MKIVSNLNGNTKTTSYGNKLFFRNSPYSNYTQVKRAFYRSSPYSQYVQVYLYDSVSPSITITSPSNITTINNAYTFTASVTDTESGIASITINGVNYPVTSGVTSVQVAKAYTLSVGTNTFTIVVKDTAGNSTQKSISLKYMAPSSVVSINGTVTGDYWEDFPQGGGYVDRIEVYQDGRAQIWYWDDGWTGGNVSVDVHTPFKLISHQGFAGKSRVRINGTYTWDGTQFGWISGYTAIANGVDVTSKISALSFSDSQNTGPGFDISRLTDTEKVNLVITGTLNGSIGATAHAGWSDIEACAQLSGTVSLY